MEWVIIEQDEGLMVDYEQSNGVKVFMVDYDEASQNPEYAREKLKQLEEMSEFLPLSHVNAIRFHLKEFV